MAKYEKLTDWLNNPQRNPQRLLLTLREIEHIIEDHLPESAHKYIAWWGRNESPSSVMLGSMPDGKSKASISRQSR